MNPRIDPVDIALRLDWTESEELELKSAKGGLPKDLWETYSAMANTHGGIILLGVQNDGTVTGIRDPERQKKAFWDTINNRGKVSANLLTDSDAASLSVGAETILAIRIPKATRNQRPVFLGMNPLTGTFRRNFEGDYRCTEEEVGRMLSDRSEEPADRRILENFGLDDLDANSLRQYRNRFASHKPTHPWLSEDDQRLLDKLGGWRRDRSTGTEGLTVAGLLMFGTDEAIREAMPQYHVDYREKLSADPDIRWTDRVTVDGTWAANLFQFNLRVFQRLAQDLKRPFQLGVDLFRTGETVVHEAIREALVNALIHADYRGQGGIVVEKYPDRFEFSNPGSLLVSLEQLMRGNVSECRNKTLQTMFTMIGLGEKAGSGVDKIWRGWASQHWRMPRVTDQFQPDRVRWLLPMKSMIPEDSLDRLQELFGNRFSRFSEAEVQALVTADLEGTVDNARMRQITGSHAAEMTKILQGLVGKNTLVQEGQGRWTRYRLPPSTGADSQHSDRRHSQHKGDDSQHNDLHSQHKDGDSQHNGLHSQHKEDGSVHNGGDSVHNGNNSPHKHGVHSQHNADADFPESGVDITQHWEKLLRIAEPSRLNRRLPPKETEKLILALCQGQWLSRMQLAELLQRHEEGIRARFLVPMVQHGLLRLRYPDKPNRADQAYTANRGDDESDQRESL